MFQTGISITSLIISIVTFIVAFGFQMYFFLDNRRKLEALRDFFKKRREYGVVGEADESRLDPEVAKNGTGLHALIEELNEYTRKNHGTTDFSIIQNKTERKIDLMYEDATSKIAFPTYIGLMGTFVGVFLGLLFFTIGLGSSANGEGITDQTIGSLISGVLVSMSTSFVGLLLTTLTHHIAAETQKVVGGDKSRFYEFIQNELMPTLGVSMVAALNKLHHTINLFEPSFNRVIGRFQSTFDACTQRFGDAFENNVTVVSQAVATMGSNMDKINDNVDLQAKLLNELRSGGVLQSLNAFVEASKNFGYVNDAVARFDQLNDRVRESTEKLMEAQANYNKSLETPITVAEKVNGILNRVTDFEKSINALGRSIEKTDLVANTEIEALKDAIRVIKQKQNIAVEAMEVADSHLRDIYKMQSDAIAKIGHDYEVSFGNLAEHFQNVLQRLEKEMLDRRREIVAALEEKFSIDSINKEFSQLAKLERIESLLDTISSDKTKEEMEQALIQTRKDILQIRKLVHKAVSDPGRTSDRGWKLADQLPAVNPKFLVGLFGRNKIESK